MRRTGKRFVANAIALGAAILVIATDVAQSDDSRWDAFLLDEDECDPLPEDGDFWTDQISDSEFRCAD